MKRFPKVGGQNVLDPRELVPYTESNDTPKDYVNRVNSIRVPAGKEPGQAWFLLTRSSAEALQNAQVSITWWDEHNHSSEITFVKWILYRAISMNLVFEGDADAAYLVEFRDIRLLMARSAFNEQYNVRIPTPSNPLDDIANSFYPETINGSSIWTWEEMLEDIWGNINEAGAFPGLANVTIDTEAEMPENWRFIAGNPWDAFHQVIDFHGWVLGRDPINDKWEINDPDHADKDAFDAQIEGYSYRLMYDYDPLGKNSLAYLPSSIKVYFPRREMHYGIEKDTPISDNWEVQPVHEETIDIAGGGSGTISFFCDLPALYDKDNALYNSSVVAARASYYARQYGQRRVEDERRRFHHSGIVIDMLPGINTTDAEIAAVKTGVLVSEVVWRDYSLGDQRGQGGLVTETIRTPKDQSRGGTDQYGRIVENTAGGGSGGNDGYYSGYEHDNVKPPDLAQRSHPLYPHYLQIVKLTGASCWSEANDCDLFEATVQRQVWDELRDLDPCWVRFINCDYADFVARGGEYYLGRLCGTATCEDNELPLYDVKDEGTRLWKGTAVTCKYPGATVNMTIDNACDALTKQVFDPLINVLLLPGEKAFFIYSCDNDRYEFISEQGLTRIARVPGAGGIVCGGAGVVEIKSLDGWVCEFLAFNQVGSTRKVFQWEEFWVTFDRGSEQLTLQHPPNRNLRYIATLTVDMCSDSGTFEFDNVEKLDYCPGPGDPDPEEAKNRFDLKGEIGDYVYVVWNESTCDYEIIQVKHKDWCGVVDVLTKDDDSGNLAALVQAQMKISAMFCDADKPTETCEIIPLGNCEDELTTYDESYTYSVSDPCCDTTEEGNGYDPDESEAP